MEKKEIPLMFCFDNNYVIPAAVAFYSLLEHCNRDYYYKLYILHTDISKKNQNKLIDNVRVFSDFSELIFINMENKFENLWQTIETKGHFSKEVMYKILVASIFPQYDKMIVSDVDVVFLNDISESYSYLDCNEDYYLAGVKVIGKMQWYVEQLSNEFTQEEIKKLSGFCGGYIVFNLKKLRDDKMEEKFIKCFETEGDRINQMEQDVLNLCCYPKTKQLPLKYLACSYMWDEYNTEDDKETDIHYSKEEIEDAMKNTVQLHYATSKKPWKNINCTKSEVWFEYLMKTNFVKEYFNYLPNNIVLPEKRVNQIKQSEEKKIREEVRDEFLENYTIYNRILKRLEYRQQYLFFKIIKYFLEYPFFFVRPIFYKKLIRKIIKKIDKQNYTILIIDNIFPSFYSPCRTEEFINYLKEFKNVYVLATWKAIPETEKLNNNKLIEKFEIRYPEFKGRIINIQDSKYENKVEKLKNKIAVMTYFENVEEQFELLNKNKIPFIFTLYPEGKFELNDANIREKLKLIFSSNYFKKVIVTEKYIKKYLIKNKLCNTKKIKIIPGAVIQAEMFKGKVKSKMCYGINKKTLDICFADYEHFNKTRKDGYDTFIEIVKKFANNKKIEFHVVGKHKKQDIPFGNKITNIKYYGIKSPDDFLKILKKVDILMSLNDADYEFESVPNDLCIHAMLNKVVVMCLKSKKNNNFFINNKDYMEINHNNVNEDIIKKIEYILKKPKKMKKIATKGRKKAQKLYSNENQIQSRIELIRKLAKKYYKK